MAGCTYIPVLRLTVITEILLLCVAQNTHRQNVAIGKTCGISSKYFNSDNCSAAINGNNINLHYPGNCIRTADSDKSPFWWVDLGNEFTISTMTIYGRTNHTYRMTQVNIFLDENIVKSFTSQDTWINDEHVITVGRAGRIVNITKDSNTGSPLNMCEVEVWVCDDGWYGDCTQACTYCPRGSDCDKVDGNCTTCETGFKLPHCEACDDGWYGDNCTQACGHCAGDSVCNKVTGSCTSCQTGFQSPLCKECQDGWFGDSCAETCGHCVGGNSTCDKTNGSCPSCDGELQLPLCKESMTLEQTKSSGPPVGSIVGPVLAVVVAAVVAVIVVVWLRKLRKSRSQQPNEADGSPYEISMTSAADPSMPTSRPDKKADDTSDYSNIGDSINIYDALKAPDDDSTAVYTSLRCHANAH